ncbi:MAG: hypothetical protein JEZ09_09355 [Salinivirgaceae bacterium]|nr:hypothetical protein [Salinivirgaceae bacterium]
MKAIEFIAQFKDKLSANHPLAEYIILANHETTQFRNSLYVVVENAITKDVIFNLSINCVIPETFYRGITFINNCIVIAVDNFIYMFNIKTRKHFQFRIDGFFDSFCLEKDLLLVRSNTHVTCIDSNNKVIWNSERVAYEKDYMKKLTFFPTQNSVNWELNHNWAFLKIHFLDGLNLAN